MDKVVNFFRRGFGALAICPRAHGVLFCMVCSSKRNGLCIPGVFMSLRILLSGNIETNPGPLVTHQNEADCLSMLHLNTRRFRHKLDYIKENFLDFDVLCFTATHLTNDVTSDMLI